MRSTGSVGPSDAPSTPRTPQTPHTSSAFASGLFLDVAGELARARTWALAEFLVEEAFQLTVLAEGSGRLAGGGEELNEVGVEFFAERLLVNSAARALDRAGEVALSLKQKCELQGGLEVTLRQAVLFGEDPVFREARKEASAVTLHRIAEMRGLPEVVLRLRGQPEGLLEPGNISGEGIRV